MEYDVDLGGRSATVFIYCYKVNGVFITIDFDTLEDGQVTVRERDSMQQVRMPISELKAYIEEKIQF